MDCIFEYFQSSTIFYIKIYSIIIFEIIQKAKYNKDFAYKVGQIYNSLSFRFILFPKKQYFYFKKIKNYKKRKAILPFMTNPKGNPLYGSIA